MKQYTHAWLALTAVKKIENYKLKSKKDQQRRDNLVKWLKSHNDGITQGAWYPDSLIKDNSSGHILKFDPSPDAQTSKFKKLPTNLFCYKRKLNGKLCGPRKLYPQYGKPYLKDKRGTLPDRCEAFCHTVIDSFKVQQRAERGEAIVPTSNQIALQLFMLSHYICDAHMPLHCDGRPLDKLHSAMEGEWEDDVKKYYLKISGHKEFLFDKDGHLYLSPAAEAEYAQSILGRVEGILDGRTEYVSSLGPGNNKVYDYMFAVCQYSYLMAYSFWPSGAKWNGRKWRDTMDIDQLSLIVLTDAVESTAKIWFHTWKKYCKWQKK